MAVLLYQAWVADLLPNSLRRAAAMSSLPGLHLAVRLPQSRATQGRLPARQTPLPPMPPREPVSSSTISAIDYDDECLILEVEFAPGILYRYHGVPAEVYYALCAARSKGKFFNEHIKDCYPSEQME